MNDYKMRQRAADVIAKALDQMANNIGGVTVRDINGAIARLTADDPIQHARINRSVELLVEEMRRWDTRR